MDDHNQISENMVMKYSVNILQIMFIYFPLSEINILKKKKKEFNYFYMLIGFYLIYVNNYHIYKYLKNALHDLHKHD